jgi:hypothetical protein
MPVHVPVCVCVCVRVGCASTVVVKGVIFFLASMPRPFSGGSALGTLHLQVYRTLTYPPRNPIL